MTLPVELAGVAPRRALRLLRGRVVADAFAAGDFLELVAVAGDLAHELRSPPTEPGGPMTYATAADGRVVDSNLAIEGWAQPFAPIKRIK